MLWLILGIVIGFAWHWMLTWSRGRGIRISWWFWLLVVLSVITALSGIQNYVALLQEYEEQAAGKMIPIYSFQVLLTGVPALLILWRQVRRSRA